MTEENVFEMQHAESNSDVEENSRSGKGSKRAKASSQRSDKEDVIAAVREEIRCNKAEWMEDVKKDLLPSITACIKKTRGQTTSKERKRKKRQEHDFKNKGNKRRFLANEEILEKIEDGIDALEEKDLQEAKEAMKTGRDLMLKQQKLIRIADREEHGWDVVKHYESDYLASDSDDEKNLKRARREALATIKKTAKYKASDESARYNTQFRKDHENGNRSGRQATRGRSGEGTSTTDPRICYNCGQTGHLQYVCPRRYGRN